MLLLLGAARCNSDRPFIALRPIITGTVYNVVTVMLLLLLSLHGAAHRRRCRVERHAHEGADRESRQCEVHCRQTAAEPISYRLCTDERHARLRLANTALPTTLRDPAPTFAGLGFRV